MSDTDLVTTFKQCRTTSYLNLSPPARMEYEKVCRYMMAQGTLKSCDLPVVATYAQAQIDIRKAQEEIDQYGMTIVCVDRYGHEKRELNPAVKIKRDAERQVGNLAVLLGFTPTGRKRLKGETKEPPSDLDKFMEGLNGGSKA